MAVLTLPHQSRATILSCIAVQTFVLAILAVRGGGSVWAIAAAFVIGGFLTDLISGIAHFGFDYVWRPTVPILGPVAVEFREHHEEPTLDPSALLVNFTKAAYGALPCAIVALLASVTAGDTTTAFLVRCTLWWASVWMLGFHQIHSYAHMGGKLSPGDFNDAVRSISALPSRRDQKREFARLFEAVGIPPMIRFLQRTGLFLRPEVHWRHHQSFESDFSSVNGWSDPLTNWIYGPIARRRKASRAAAEQNGG